MSIAYSYLMAECIGLQAPLNIDGGIKKTLLSTIPINIAGFTQKGLDRYDFDIDGHSNDQSFLSNFAIECLNVVITNTRLSSSDTANAIGYIYISYPRYTVCNGYDMSQMITGTEYQIGGSGTYNHILPNSIIIPLIASSWALRFGIESESGTSVARSNVSIKGTINLYKIAF